IRAAGETDVTVEEMETTVEEFYKAGSAGEAQAIGDLALDADLADIFLKPSPRRRKGIRPAAELVAEDHKAVVDKGACWTGLRRPLAKALVASIERRVGDLRLAVERSRESAHLVELTTYATTLALNYVNRGRFIQP